MRNVFFPRTPYTRGRCRTDSSHLWLSVCARDATLDSDSLLNGINAPHMHWRRSLCVCVQVCEYMCEPSSSANTSPPSMLRLVHIVCVCVCEKENLIRLLLPIFGLMPYAYDSGVPFLYLLRTGLFQCYFLVMRVILSVFESFACFASRPQYGIRSKGYNVDHMFYILHAI